MPGLTSFRLTSAALLLDPPPRYATPVLVGSAPVVVPPVASAPTITGFSPVTAPVDASVTITGAGFGDVPGTAGTVKFNGILANVLNWSATSIVAKVPAGGATGKITVTTAQSPPAVSTDTFTVASAGMLDFSDNSTGFRYAPYLEQQAGFVQRSAFAQLVLKTNHTSLLLLVQNYGNGSDGSGAANSYPQTEVGYRLNGVRQAPLRSPLGAGFNRTVRFSTITLTLPALTAGQYHEIELTEGTTYYLSDTYTSNVSIVRLEGTGGDTLAVVPLVRRPKRVMMNLDSIGVSANNSDPTGAGIITRAREDFDLTDWEFATDGAAGAYDENRYGTDAAFQAHISRATGWLSGATVPLYFKETITNSWGNHSTPNAFFNVSAHIVDGIRTAMPTVKQLLQTAFVRTNGSNNQGYSLQQFSDMIAPIVSARPQYTVRLDASGVLMTNELRDGVHPTDAGEIKVYQQWKAWFLANASAATGSGVPAAVYTPLGNELVVGPTRVENNELNRKAASGYTLVYSPSIDVEGSSGATAASSNEAITVFYPGDPYTGEISYNINSKAMEITTQDGVFVGTGLEICAPLYSEGAQWELVVDNVVVDSGSAQGAQTATQVMAKVHNLPFGRHPWKYRLVNYAPGRTYLMVDYIDFLG